MTAPLSLAQPRLYRTIWRWHFYAGLFVLPFIITLSCSGALYLFKPQIEQWEERAFYNLPTTHAVAPHKQVKAALSAYPGASFLEYRLPKRTDAAALIRLSLPEEQGVREVFVSPEGEVLGSFASNTRIMALVKRIHSELLVGKVGNLLVELAASWAIVLLLSGLYLWWPRGQKLADVIRPRLTQGKRVFWRDLHAITGFWISGLALILLLTGLPWTGVWGSAFQAVRTEMGWVKGNPKWHIDSQPQAGTTTEDHSMHTSGHPVRIDTFAPEVFDAMVAKAQSEQLAFPALVIAPAAPGRFGQPGEMVWTIRSDAPNVLMQQTVRFDLEGRHELSREKFQDRHIVDRLVGYGIAWHEGQLFGWVNQLFGMLTAIGLITLACSGFVLWYRRKPVGNLGAPLAGAMPSTISTAILLMLALLLPLLASSLVLVWLLEQLVLARLLKLALWLGLSS